jgi:ferrous iron transport protein A
MLLSQLEKNDKAVLKNIINCNEEIRGRFFSFGIVRGAHISVEEVTLSKNTVEIMVEGTAIALRIDEANYLEVERVK